MKPGFGNIEVVFRRGAPKPVFSYAEIGPIDAYTIDIVFDIALNESKVPDAGDLIPTFSGGATQIYDRTITGEHLYVKTGVNDWYLPSRDELLEVATVLDSPYGAGVRTFNADYYNTSSEFDADNSVVIDFGVSDHTVGSTSKTILENVCPIRSFTSYTNYNLTDISSSGGYIFHKTDNGNSTYTYLEAAPDDFPQGTVAWSNVSLLIGTTSTAIGTGQANTTAIINQVGHITSAAKLCNNLVIGRAITIEETGTIQYVPNAVLAKKLQGLTGAKVDAFTESVDNYLDNYALKDLDGNVYTEVTIGTQIWLVENLKTTKYADSSVISNIRNSDDANDWFLPSKDELNEMYVNLYLFGIGEFQDTHYWSSSEVSATTVYTQRFSVGPSIESSKTLYPVSIRPCRSFTAAIGAYALRDIGPTGGLIFYTDGAGNYLEAAPVTTSVGYQWSDVTDQLIGTTGTAIGTGQANTTAMLAQSATAPSAKDCDDYLITGWANDITGAYCWYNNDVANKTIYGGLYNWHSVNNVKGLAYITKEGVNQNYRIPTDNDLTVLSNYLGGDSVSGGKLKETGTTHWASPNTGATNESDFTFLPGGSRGIDGTFANINNNGYLSSSTEFDGSNSWYRMIATSGIDVSRNSGNKKFGFSIRLVKDA